jgi:hypothetical protein
MAQGSARIENSTINDNYNSLGSAGLQCSAATLLMSNVTFSTNAPANRGGGLFLSACDATLRNVTIAGGSASVQGGGIYSNSDSVVRLANTIIADNSAPSGADFYAANTTVTLLTNNIIEGGITDGGGNTVNGAGTIQQIDPQLAALAENGGTVKTQALGATSPAIDAGTNGEALDTQTVPQALMTDARGTGFARVRNGDGNGSAIVDLGAFEYIALPTAATVTIGGRVLTNSRRGLSNALVYLTDFSGDMRTARTNSLGYYRFNDIVAGQSVTITVVSKRYQFAPQVVNVNEEMSGLNFLAEQ